MNPVDPGLPFAYDGPEELRAPVEAALRTVIDPEVALNIVDIGLVYRVQVADGGVHVLLTMTSAACPVSDVLLDDVESALQRVLPQHEPTLELTWEPPWGPERLSASAREFMGW